MPSNHSSAVSAVQDFKMMALAAPLQKGLEACGFTKPTEVQARTVPLVLMGGDVMCSAQTGTGKTAAFVLPALQRLLAFSNAPGRGPRVLILTPTRELAQQVEGVVRDLARFTTIKSGTIVGGVAYGPQERLLRQGVDLLVATPGRLMDHMEAGLVQFGRLELFVLDEADRMLDMGFILAVKRIAAALPAGRQTMLFSATLEGAVLDVAKMLMRNPTRVQLAHNHERHRGITQQMQFVNSSEHKHKVLAELLESPEMTQAIIFTATKRGADRLAKRLSTQGHSCSALHGNMRQSARQRTVAELQSGKVQFLVATDVAARGIDIEGVSHVINYDLPTVAEDYIHRIGRTGRNGATGIAVSLVSPQDTEKLRAIERLTGGALGRVAGTNAVPFLSDGAKGASSGNGRGASRGRSAQGGQRGRGGRGGSASNGNGRDRAANANGNGKGAEQAAAPQSLPAGVRSVVLPGMDAPRGAGAPRRRSRPVATRRGGGW